VNVVQDVISVHFFILASKTLFSINSFLHRPLVPIGVASMRQGDSTASCSCNCVLVSSVKSSLNTAPKCSSLRSNNKKKSVRGWEGDTASPHPTPLGALDASTNDLSTLPLLKLKSGYALAGTVRTDFAVFYAQLFSYLFQLFPL